VRAPDVGAAETCAAPADTRPSEMSSTAHARATAEMGAAAHAGPTTAEMGAAAMKSAASPVKSTAATVKSTAAASSGSRVGRAGQNGRQSHNGKNFEF
jgi:hypothetical protein